MSEEFKTQSRESYREPWPEPPPVPRPDMLNRLMSLGALIIACAALLHSMGGLTAFQGAGEAVTAAAKSVDDGIDAVANNLAGSDAEDVATEDSAAPVDDSANRQDEPSETELADQAQPAAGEDAPSDDVNDLFTEPADSALASSDQAEGEHEPTDASEPESMIEMIDRYPVLRIARTALRPTHELAAAYVLIQNTGTAEAVITEAIFMPTEVNKLPVEIAKARVGMTSADRLVVRFTGDDNQASQPGRHADYARTLRQPFSVPAGETVEVRVAIEGGEHAGFGFTGDLRLKFGENEDLEVGGMTVAFVE